MTETLSKRFINEMANQYTLQFNVYRDEAIGSIPLDFYAEFQRRDEKYLMSKSIKVWGVEVQQYAFVTQLDEISKETVQRFADEIDLHIPSFVPKKQEHMTTYFVGVIVTNKSINHEIIKHIKRARKIQFLKYGWYGWADRYIAVVSLKDKSVYVHKKGREFITAFESALLKGDAEG